MTDGEMVEMIHRHINAENTRTSAEELSIAVLKDRAAYQAVCAAAYQLAGTVGAPVRFLDALGDAANGCIGERVNPDDLLPVNITECDGFK